MFEKLFGSKNKNSKLVDEIEKSMNAIGINVKRKGNILVFDNAAGETIISSRKIRSHNGKEAADDEHFTIKSLLSGKLVQSMGDEKITVLNAMAGLSALIKDNGTKSLFLANALSCNDNEVDAWNSIYKPLIIFSSFFQVELLLATLKNLFGVAEPLDIPKKSQPSYWDRQDFDHAAYSLNRANFVAFADNKGLTVEFPFEPNGISAVFGGKTSLLQLRSDMPHPILGNGLFFKLELPIQLEETEQHRLCGQLNKFEFEAKDAPPFFGAWCINNSSGGLAHVGFWPNLLYRKGSSLNIATWMAGRNEMVQGFFQKFVL